MIGLNEYYKFEFYYKALRIRMVEEWIARKYPEQEMRCPVHLSLGQEANAVAIASCLTDRDYMVSTHRAHAHYLAKGGPLDGLIGELYGRSIGCSGGYGGSMHLTAPSCGFMGSTSIVGGTIPIGVGLQFASQVKNEERVTAVCLGDAATEEGVFHESANFASIHNLPVIFFLENNNYSCFTPRKDRQPSDEDHFYNIAYAHDLDYFRIKKEAFYEHFISLNNRIKEIRKSHKKWPILVECEAFRKVEHCGPNNDDHLKYRSSKEIEDGKRYDPIEILEIDLVNTGYLSESDKKKVIKKIEKEINDAYEKVLKSPYSEGIYLHA